MGVLQPGVHAVAADGGVLVPGVAGEEDPVLAERRGDAVVDAVVGEPVHRLVGQPEVALGRVQCVLLADVVLRGKGHHAGVAGPAEGEREGEGLLAEPGDHRAVGQPAHTTQVRHPEHVGIGDPLERDVHLAAHGRGGTVGADAPPRPDAHQPGGPVEQSDDAAPVGVVAQVHEPVAPADRVALCSKICIPGNRVWPWRRRGMLVPPSGMESPNCICRAGYAPARTWSASPSWS